MISFTQHKTLNTSAFTKYLEVANSTNQFTNYGYAVRLLEQRARSMLLIDSSKAIIAVCNGAAALNAIVTAIRTDESVYSQDFTFPCNFQIADVTTKVFDMTSTFEPDIEVITERNSIVIITNCFGHVVNIDKVLSHAKKYNLSIIFDNAAAPYSMYSDSNISNYGVASYISLHHTKPIGFGEGGLIVIDKQYEDKIRSIINFGMIDRVPTYKGNNYKMSELAAAGILQWWDSFSIDSLRDKYLVAYNYYLGYTNLVLPNYSNNFFPNCLPALEHKITVDMLDIRKYYKPNVGLRYSSILFDKINCIPLTEHLND
jgi:dTDP-4-amino-4,6-dideoxygalactose transaminase